MANQTMIDRYLFVRQRAIAMNDIGLLREAEENLRHYGWRPDASPAELDRAAARADADAVPAGRGLTRRARTTGPE